MNRIASAAALSALLLSTLAGCFLLPQAEEGRDRPSEAVEAEEDDSDGFASIGDCWQTNFSDMAEWQWWEGDDPVDCEEDHQSYTYYVGDLDAEVETPWEDGSITGELSSAVSEQCAQPMRDLGVPEEAARAGLYFFVAEEDDWEDGDHRIRCDIAVSALGSDWNDPELEDLPEAIDELVDDIDDNARSYELCLIGDAFGPYESSEAYYSDCGDSDYSWRYAGTVEVPSEEGDAYPADDTLYAFADEECAAFGARGDETVLPYVPTQQMWDSGYREVNCWFSLIDLPSTPV